ncbi:MAG: hypothetical protein ACOC9Y_02300 [Chloroflexota bacterium]
MAQEYPRGETTCVCGSGITTRLRCSRCGKPICYDCMVESPVGYRCPQCSSGPRIGAYHTTNTLFLKAAGVGLLIAVAVGIFWGLFPTWNFYMALLLGFGAVEGMAWAANYKRGADLQIAAFGVITIGIIVSRYTIALDNGLDVSVILQNLGQPFFRDFFYLRLIPDFLFMAIPYVIAYIRFR